MRPRRSVAPRLQVRLLSNAVKRKLCAASLAAGLFLLALLPFVSACGNPNLSYLLTDGDHRDYQLNMAVTEKGPNGEALGTVSLEALLSADVYLDKQHPCACYVTIDYDDAKLDTDGLAQSSGNQIPTAYFPLREGHLLAFTGPAWRGDGCCVELARTGPNGSLSAMLLNMFLGECLAQPLRDARHELKIGNEWETTRQLPGNLMSYLYAGQRLAKNQSWETTQVRVTQLAGDQALADMAWSSVAPLWSSWPVDLTERLLEIGIDPEQIAAMALGEWEATRTVNGSYSCSGTTSVRVSDGWPQRASVDRMTIDLVSSWSYPEDLLSPDDIQPERTTLEITGSIDAL